MRKSNLEHSKYIDGSNFNSFETFKNKNGDLKYYSDNFNETEDGILDSSLKQTLTNNHDLQAKKSHLRGQLRLEKSCSLQDLEKNYKNIRISYHLKLQIFRKKFTQH